MLVRHSLETRPQTTAHLAQTMSFLALSTTELEETLVQEIDANPALELIDELRCPECGKRLRQLPCPSCVAPQAEGAPIVYLSPRAGGLASVDRQDDAEFPEPRTPERLDEYVLKQVGPALSAEEHAVAAYILARLDDHGLLPESAAEVAVFTHAKLTAVEHVLALIQRADPPGLGACSPQESLLIQLECLADTAPADVISAAGSILQHHLADLGRMRYGPIAHALKIDRDTVLAAARFIQRNLTPYPARVHWGEGKGPAAVDEAALRNPDTTISLLDPAHGGPLLVEVFSPLAGWLRVNPEFKSALSECSAEDRERWTPAVERATLITKCVQQRNHTMRRLMEIIAAEQRAFILGGDGDLKPLTRAQIARQLGVHESTISRAVAAKCAALPDGRLVPLSKFFDRSLSVRDRVRHIIQAEARPLTDDAIAAALELQGLHVARRTVAKYRNMLGILPANARKRQARSHALMPTRSSSAINPRVVAHTRPAALAAPAP